MGAREVMKKVRDGYRLERPAHCHPDLYQTITKCWLGDMNRRPDFSELRKVRTTLPTRGSNERSGSFHSARRRPVFGLLHLKIYTVLNGRFQQGEGPCRP